ncbi:MAG: DUF2809 domain-containing protein [Candidatus Marinimicrobia bacterium]|nr:DUF2809 domain-containing protein [Candidatus Neomarinimicrobiota bacterium]
MNLLQKKYTIIIIIILIPIGLYTKLYNGFASSWGHDSLGGIFYVIFWSLFFSVIFQKTKPLKITVIVFSITTFLEILQLWHPVFLEIIRDSFIGKAMLGTSFFLLDIFHYIIGFIASFWLIKKLRKIES